jgi:hypothetical protein
MSSLSASLLVTPAAALERPHHLLGPLRRAEEIGVVQRDVALAAALDLADHLVDRAIAELQAVHQRLGAEGAAVMAAARGLDEGPVDVAVALDEVVARHRHVDHRMQLAGFVDAAQLALLEVVEHLRHHELGLADHHGIGMLERLAGHEARMHPAHDDRNAARPERVRDLVAALDVAGHRRDADQIRLQVEVDRLDVLVGQHDLVLVGRNRRRHRQQAGNGRVESSVHVKGAGGERLGLRIDQMNSSRAHPCYPQILQLAQGAPNGWSRFLTSAQRMMLRWKPRDNPGYGRRVVAYSAPKACRRRGGGLQTPASACMLTLPLADQRPLRSSGRS